MDAKLTRKARNWLKTVLDDADLRDDVKTKVDADGKYIRTPWALCEEIVREICWSMQPGTALTRDPELDYLISESLRGKKILVVDTVEFIPVLLAFGAEKCNITYVAPYAYKGSSIAGVIGVRVVQQSLLEWKPDMKFNVVVGNPPYKQGMWRKFLEKSLPLATELEVFVTPDATIETTVKHQDLVRLLKDNGIQSVTPCHYPHFKDVKTSSEISYHLFDKRTTFNAALFSRDLSNEEKITLSIIGKVKKAKEKYGGLTQTMRVGGKQKGASSSIQVITNVTQTGVVFSTMPRSEIKVIDDPSGLVFVNKFFGMNSTDLIYIHQGEVGVLDDNVYYIGRENLSAEDFYRIYLSKLMRFVLAYYRGTNSRTLGWSIRELPIISGDIFNLYDHFGLTQEEIDYIEATVK